MPKKTKLSEDQIELNNLTQLHDAVIPYFSKLWTRGTENEKYYSADPFTDEDKQKHSAQNRLPFSISSIPNKLNSIISTEKQNRSEWKVDPILDFIDSQDSQEIAMTILEKELKAAIASTRLKTIARQNKMKFVASDIFASGVAIMFGWGEVYVDKDLQGNDVIKLREGDYQNLIWDINAVDYERNKAQWMAKREFQYRIDVQKKYGKRVANKLAIQDAMSWASRQKQQYYVQYNRDGVSDLDLLAIFTHYQKVLRDYHVVLFNGNIVSEEKNKKDADDIAKMLQYPFLSEGRETPPIDVVKNTKLCLDKYCFTYTDLLDYEQTDLTLFPFSIYSAFQFKEKIWTMSDILKSMQQLANRMLSQIDFAFGKDIKNNYEIDISALEGTGMTVEEALQNLKDDKPIFNNGRQVLRAIESQGANPQWVQIMQIMLQLIDEIGGGKTFSGSPNSSGQSGKAINALIGQGQLLTNTFIDNRNRFQADLANKVMEFMKLYDNTPYIIKTEGGALTPAMIQLLQKYNMYIPHSDNKTSGYVRMNEGNNYLLDTEYQISVEMEDMSPNKKEQEYEMMTVQEKSDPDLLLSPTWKRKKLSKLSDISFEEREKIIQEIEQAKQQQQQLAEQARQEQLNLERAKAIISDKGNQTENIKENAANNQNK